MSTDTQPATIKAGILGNGGEFDAIAGGNPKVRLIDEYVLPGQCMPAMELGIDDGDKSYCGPMFSLS